MTAEAVEPTQEILAGEPEPLLVYLHHTHRSVQRLRISIGNRVNSLNRGAAIGLQTQDYYQTHLLPICDLEERLEREIEQALHEFPVWDYWLCHVQGIGPGLGGQLLALLRPPRPGMGPSTWSKAAGLVPEQRPDGMMRLPRTRQGEGKITYHPGIRHALYNVAVSFLRSGRYYRTVYDEAKSRLAALHAGDAAYPPYRVDRIARIMMVKRFLSHLWEMWSECDGIASRHAYVVEKLGHTYYPAPRWESNRKI